MEHEPRVLIAEDETLIRLDLRAILESAGLIVCAEARDGEEAVSLALAEKPDLAILDVKMPRLDGVEVARRILAERPVPIVMVSSYGYGEVVSRALDAGVFAYIVKPFREADLLEVVWSALDLAAPEHGADRLQFFRSAGGDPPTDAR